MTYIIIFVTAVVSIVCFSNRRYLNALSMNPYRIFHNREWYRIITHGFVHGNSLHLIVNMIVLLSFGLYIEQLFALYEKAGTMRNGTLNYFILYFGGMIAASIYDIVKSRNNPNYSSIGASGAVAAVIFASIFFDPWKKLYFFGVLPIPGIVFGVLYVVYSQYMSTREARGINHHAHLYGALFGFIYPLLIDPSFFSVFLTKITQF